MLEHSIAGVSKEEKGKLMFNGRKFVILLYIQNEEKKEVLHIKSRSLNLERNDKDHGHQVKNKRLSYYLLYFLIQIIKFKRRKKKSVVDGVTKVPNLIDGVNLHKQINKYRN